MGLKKGPLNGLLWVFRVFLLLGGLLDAMAGYYPLDTDHTAEFRLHKRETTTLSLGSRGPVLRGYLP
jgi:hypothetical protein